MQLPQLPTAVLYFASSAAQVWGALMVFQVLLIRDLCLYREENPKAGADEYPEPAEVFQNGIGALGLNLGALAAYPFLSEDPTSLLGLLGALVIANFAFGWKFAAHCRRALVCY